MTEIEAGHCSAKEQLGGHSWDDHPIHGDGRQHHSSSAAGQAGRGEPALPTALSAAAREGELPKEAPAPGRDVWTSLGKAAAIHGKQKSGAGLRKSARSWYCTFLPADPGTLYLPNGQNKGKSRARKGPTFTEDIRYQSISWKIIVCSFFRNIPRFIFRSYYMFNLKQQDI